MMGLIDHQDNPFASAMLFQDVIDQGQPQLLFAAAFHRQGQIVRQRLEKPEPIAKMRVDQEGRLDHDRFAWLTLLSQPIKQAMAQQGLAQTWSSGQHQQTFAIGQTFEEFLQRPFMPGCGIVTGMVGSGRKRPPSQLEVGLDHDPASPQSKGRTHGVAGRAPLMEIGRHGSRTSTLHGEERSTRIRSEPIAKLLEQSRQPDDFAFFA
jgi:hypothetical protein